MKRKTVLLAVTDPAQVSSGLQPDRHSLQQPLWERASNVRFYDGKIKRLIPPSTLADAGLSGNLHMRGMHQQQLSTGVNSVIVAITRRTSTPPAPDVFAQSFYRWDGSTFSLLS